MNQRKNGKLLLNPYFLLSKIVSLVAMQLKLKARPCFYRKFLTVKFAGSDLAVLFTIINFYQIKFTGTFCAKKNIFLGKNC